MYIVIDEIGEGYLYEKEDFEIVEEDDIDLDIWRWYNYYINLFGGALWTINFPMFQSVIWIYYF